MIIGILSDNHGRTDGVRHAVDVFVARGVGAVFHCGDVGGLETLRMLAATGLPVWFVWGNTDHPEPDWASEIAAMGLRWPDGPIVVELAGKRIALCHGHEWQFAALRHDASLHYVLSGHSHRRHDEHVGPVRLINPGALHRTPIKTVATLDLTQDLVEFHSLPA